MKIISIVFAFILFGCVEQNQRDTAAFDAKVGEIFADWNGQEPGGAVAVIENGKAISEQYYGLANLESGEPFSEQTVTDVGSISKQFTACLIALLEEEGKLSIEDNIRNYLPELPDFGEVIRIKHLLFHVSGIKDYEALVMMKGQHYFDDHMTNDYVLELIVAQQSLNFLPGTQYEYSNSNYILLSVIAERLSGKRLNELAKEKIFDPLKMKRSFFHINQGVDFEHRAIGYTSVKSSYERPVYRSHLVGDGGLFTTLKDMIRWDQNYFDNRLGKGGAVLPNRMKHREPLSDGRSIGMAFAQIFTIHSFGENSWSHGGSGGGYRSFYIRFEEPKFSVIVLANADSRNAFEKANKVVALYFDDQSVSVGTNEVEHEQESEAPLTIVTTSEMIERMEGFYYSKPKLSVIGINYRSDQQSFQIKWMENNDNGYQAKAISENTIAENEDLAYQYQLTPDNKRLLHTVSGKLDRSWDKLKKPKLGLAKFVGSYYAEEIDHAIQLSIKDERLFSANNFFNALLRIGDAHFLDLNTGAIVSFDIKERKEPKVFTVDIPGGDRNLRNLGFVRNE